MGWIFLIVAGIFEVTGTTAFRSIEGWTRPLPIVLFALSGALSLFFLFRSLETVPLGTAYAVWTGMGAAGTVLVGIAWFGEPSTTIRLVLLVVLVGSIVGLKLTSA